MLHWMRRDHTMNPLSRLTSKPAMRVATVFTCVTVGAVAFASTANAQPAGMVSSEHMAPAAQVRHAAQPDLASPTARPASLASRLGAQTSAGFIIENLFNGACLDGREGHGNVTLWPCFQDGTHEDWSTMLFPGGGFYIVNQFNGQCLDGREGHGNVTLWPCLQDGTHEDWQIPVSNDGNAIYLKNVFNSQCVDGRLGWANVNLWQCGQDGSHEDWNF
jgi:hypothetical protein